MAIIEEGNWSFKDPGDDIPDGSTINAGNFTQATVDTIILAGKTLTINGGNWINVKVDANWTINGGKFKQRSFCANLHPKWVDNGWLDGEVENCPHVVDTDAVRIDSVLVDNTYYYEDGVL